MTPLHRWIVDLFNTLAAWYYRRKYGVAARQLGRAPSSTPLGGTEGGRGLIILEIDGLGYPYLRQALEQGRMPYLARLLMTLQVRMAPWRCGVPSTTPASQAGIMYGNNWDIPGFRWYDKATGESIMCKLPGSVRAIQERVSAGRPGLLQGGSSYVNMFDGGARLALFTLSAMGRDRLLENVRGLGFLILFALSPVRVIKIAALSFWTWLAYVVKRYAWWLRPPGSHFTFLGPLLEITNNVVFREVTTFSVMVDIYRGMPAIYAAYTGYDEIAHHFGADSREAFRALHSIDKQIRQIERLRQVYSDRAPGTGSAYDLYILSDHGMTPSISFRTAYGQRLEQFIAEHTGHEVHAGDDGRSGGWLPETRVHFLLDEIDGLQARPRGALPARLLHATRRQIEARLLEERLAADWDLSRRGEIVVRNSGSLSHVYLNVTERQMDVSEIVLLYPSLVETLVAHEGVGAVIGREGDEAVVVGREGTAWLAPGKQRVEGKHPLGYLEDVTWAEAQVTRLARFPHAGDLILLGAWDGERVVSFEEQVASHGGLGGAQDWPFAIYPARRRLHEGEVEGSEGMYGWLRKEVAGEQVSK
ncbi:MAG TPA: alkaline phosphatase family protein [Anaerolineae bacterium]|nr:alkaline phosphatase family protein [Anaerolineae bacterium]